MARNALGRGLEALIREPVAPTASQAGPSGAHDLQAAAVASAQVPATAHSAGHLQVDIDLIDPSPFQPRTRFADAALEELAQSIQASGILQPLVLRKVGTRYQLIAGERRWRAAQRAGLLRIPAILREVSDEQALEITLVENIQREDLNPIEQARAFQRLMDQFHLTQDEVAGRTGKERATVANSVRLLALPPSFLEWIEDGKMTAGHGRALLAVDDPKLRLELAQKASRGKLTVRQLERMSTRRTRRKALSLAAQPLDANRQAALEELERHIGTKISLHMPAGKHAGQLIIEFYDEEQLQGIYERLIK